MSRSGRIFVGRDLMKERDQLARHRNEEVIDEKAKEYLKEKGAQNEMEFKKDGGRESKQKKEITNEEASEFIQLPCASLMTTKVMLKDGYKCGSGLGKG